MGFAADFVSKIPIDHAGAHFNANLQVGAVSSTHVPPGAIVVPDAQLLFTGDFKRSGIDLIISKDDRELVFQDYFKGEKRAALASPDGAHLSGSIVNALTGHQQFAQADGSTSVSKIIGHVSKLTGTATAIRNGVSIILNNGDNVEKGDVVQAGSNSSLGITFIDGSVFGLSSNARMVLNEMIYDPGGSNNSSLLSLVHGTLSFVAGATAKLGNMKVDTPAATMGIRGTAVLVEIDFEVPAQGNAPAVKFQVLVEPDGTTGSFILFDKTTLTPIATVSQAGTQTIVSGAGNVSFLSSAPLSDEAQRLITEVFSQRFTGTDPPKSTQFASGSSVNNLAANSGLPAAIEGAVAVNLTFAESGRTTSPTGFATDTFVMTIFIPPVIVPKFIPTGTITFQDNDPIDINSVAFFRKSSNAAADLPGFAEGIGTQAAYIGLFWLGNVTQSGGLTPRRSNGTSRLQTTIRC